MATNVYLASKNPQMILGEIANILDWLVGFNSISTFVGYLMPNPFLYKLFYFKQFSLA